MKAEQLSPWSLLMVEDDDNARDIIVRMLALRFPECRIYGAENGIKGLELFKEHAPQIVLTDINMPEMDGMEMARAIKSIDAGAVCIVLTAYGDKIITDQFKEIGFCDHLMKPVNFNQLFAVIERCNTDSKIKPE
jgi:YesN/AraC family two-component response regulator